MCLRVYVSMCLRVSMSMCLNNVCCLRARAPFFFRARFASNICTRECRHKLTQTQAWTFFCVARARPFLFRARPAFHNCMNANADKKLHKHKPGHVVSARARPVVLFAPASHSWYARTRMPTQIHTNTSQDICFVRARAGHPLFVLFRARLAFNICRNANAPILCSSTKNKWFYHVLLLCTVSH